MSHRTCCARHKARRVLAVLAVFALVKIGLGCARAEAQFEEADRLFKAGKWEQACQAYEAPLDRLQDNERAYALRQAGYTWQIRHRHEQALPYFERVLAMEGIAAEHRSGALLRLGYSLRLLKRGAEGIAALDKAAAIEGAPVTHVAEALLFAAWEHNTRGEPEAALQKFRRIAELTGVHANYVATAQLSIGRILQGQGKYRDAIGEYRKLDELNPVAATNRARARVYIKECEALLAGDVPFHIRPFVTQVTGTAATVSWVSQGEVGKGALKLKGKTNQFVIVNIGKGIEAAITPIQDTICHLQSVKLDSLQPGADYEYVVTCGGKQVTGAFRTAPAPGTPFEFSLIGDTQSYHEVLQPLLDAMGRKPTDFVLHVGDITDRGNLWGEWKAGFFDPGWPYLKDRAFWPVYGNHDGGPYFPALFGLQQQYWYSFDWGSAHFIVLDSYGAGSGGFGRQRQLDWLRSDLDTNQLPWTFVALHVPMVATRSSLKWFGADDFLPLLEEHEVDIVFSGHHPHYRRYAPIGSRGKRPIMHITSGGGGGPVGGYVPSPLLSQGINVNHFCTIKVDDEKLTLRAQAISGAEIDRFELTKRGAHGLVEHAVETEQAKHLVGFYHELLSDPQFELELEAVEPTDATETGELELVLDLRSLPRGPLSPEQFNEESLAIETIGDSPWTIQRQTFRLRDGIGRFRATPPASLSKSKGRYRPDAQVRLQLVSGKRKFATFEATARIRSIE